MNSKEEVLTENILDIIWLHQNCMLTRIGGQFCS